MAMSISFLFATINLQTASKKDLMCIKGIGEKKAEAILKYRKSHKIKSADDLIKIKGFGKGIIKNVKQNIKSVACGGKKITKKNSKNKKKRDISNLNKKNRQSSKKETSKNKVEKSN